MYVCKYKLSHEFMYMYNMSVCIYACICDCVHGCTFVLHVCMYIHNYVFMHGLYIFSRNFTPTLLELSVCLI